MKTRTFRLRVLSGVDGGAGLGGGTFNIEIQEMIHGRFGRKRIFTFVGGGLNVGITVPVAGYTETPWVDFTTYRPSNLEDFDCRGAIMMYPAVYLGPWTPISTRNPDLFFFGPMARVSIELKGIALGGSAFVNYWGHWELRGPEA